MVESLVGVGRGMMGGRWMLMLWEKWKVCVFLILIGYALMSRCVDPTSAPLSTLTRSTNQNQNRSPMPPPPLPASLDPTTTSSTPFPTSISTPTPNQSFVAPPPLSSPSTSFAKLSLLSPVVPNTTPGGSSSSSSMLLNANSGSLSLSPNQFPFPTPLSLPRHNTASPSPLSQSHSYVERSEGVWGVGDRS